MYGEPRASEPIARGLSTQTIDLEIGADLQCRRIHDAPQSPHDGVVRRERVLDILSACRGLNPNRRPTICVGDAQRQHAVPVSAGAQSTDDPALSQRVVSRIEIEVAVERPASGVGGNPAGQRPGGERRKLIRRQQLATKLTHSGTGAARRREKSFLADACIHDVVLGVFRVVDRLVEFVEVLQRLVGESRTKQRAE